VLGGARSVQRSQHPLDDLPGLANGRCAELAAPALYIGHGERAGRFVAKRAVARRIVRAIMLPAIHRKAHR
jgi:hypothetical protein